MALGLILGLGSLGTGIFGAASASNALSQAQSQAQAQQAAQAQELAGLQEGLQGLFDSQQNPADVFNSILTSLPGTLNEVVPQLGQLADRTAPQMTQSNIGTYNQALNQLFPAYAQESANQLKTIESLNPDNLGQDELKAITRAASPLLPAGTLDPTTGAVQGGTTNPASLYRNLISGAYESHRVDYLNALGGYLNNAENSALRQQAQAPSFLNEFLSTASNAANSLTQQTGQQSAQDIAAQTSLLNTVLGMSPAPINSAPYIQASTSALGGGISGLAGILGLSGAFGTSSYGTTPTASAILSNSPTSLYGGHSIAAQPSFLKV